MKRRARCCLGAAGGPLVRKGGTGIHGLLGRSGRFGVPRDLCGHRHGEDQPHHRVHGGQEGDQGRPDLESEGIGAGPYIRLNLQVLLECFGEELDPPAISKATLEKSVITIFFVASLLITITMALSLYRAVAGPGVFNRVAAVNIIGTKTIVLLVVMGYYFERPYFFDIALLYAMINFIGTLVFAKYIERGEL